MAKSEPKHLSTPTMFSFQGTKKARSLPETSKALERLTASGDTTDDEHRLDGVQCHGQVWCEPAQSLRRVLPRQVGRGTSFDQADLVPERTIVGPSRTESAVSEGGGAGSGPSNRAKQFVLHPQQGVLWRYRSAMVNELGKFW